MAGEISVADHVGEALGHALAQAPLGSTGHDALAAVALRAAGDAALPPPRRRTALRNAAEHGAAVEPLATRIIGERDTELVIGALDALFLAGARPALADIEPLAQHEQAAVRRAAAALLGHVDGAQATLAALERDSDRSVDYSATVALRRHPSQDRAAVLAAMDNTAQGRGVVIGLQRLATPWALELLALSVPPSVRYASRPARDVSG